MSVSVLSDVLGKLDSNTLRGVGDNFLDQSSSNIAVPNSNSWS